MGSYMFLLKDNSTRLISVGEKISCQKCQVYFDYTFCFHINNFTSVIPIEKVLCAKCRKDDTTDNIDFLRCKAVPYGFWPLLRSGRYQNVEQMEKFLEKAKFHHNIVKNLGWIKAQKYFEEHKDC